MMNQIHNQLPEQLKESYKASRKESPIIESLKIAAALKLWNNRGFRDIEFDVPKILSGKTVFVKVLAKNVEGRVFGIECASTVRMGWLRERLLSLQFCLPKDSYIIAVFPESVGEKADKVVSLADEVWVTGKNGEINQMIFSTTLHKG
jgi:hypothetical protein